MIAKVKGRIVSTAMVDAARPPMTARPSGADCSPPSPRARAIGIMPAIIAMLVIRIGRSLSLAPVTDASPAE